MSNVKCKIKPSTFRPSEFSNTLSELPALANDSKFRVQTAERRLSAPPALCGRQNTLEA